MDLMQRLARREGDFLLFGITPPKASNQPADLERIAGSTLQRLAAVDPDGLVVYDIAEEHDRNPQERPFPFLETVDPDEYLNRYLTGWRKPSVMYRAVGKYSGPDLQQWLQDQSADRTGTVFVGASSSGSGGLTSLAAAYDLKQRTRPDLPLGAVVIPERHTTRGDEHLRMLDKQAAGCSFFVSQIVYDTNAAKNLVSDYRDACDERGAAPVPIAFTVSVCGSQKTLEFLAWLGVHVPQWMQRDLRRTDDVLEASREHAEEIAGELVAYCRRLDIPVALNVESVSSRRSEIEAAVSLAQESRLLLRR